MKIALSNGMNTIIDDDDKEKISNKTWHFSSKGYVVNTTRKNKKCVTMYLHRILMDCPVGKVVDHANGNKLDNRKKNLRICSVAQNSQNSKKRNGIHGSKFKGVYWNKRYTKWFARITADRQFHWIGAYEKESDAARAYDAMAKKLHGEFATMNFPI